MRRNDGAIVKATFGELVAARSSSTTDIGDSSWAKPNYGNYMAQSVPAYRAIKARADAVRSAPLVVSQRQSDGSYEPVPDNHQAQMLLTLVNDWWTASDLLSATETYLSIWGSSFWYIEGAVEGRPTAIWPLRPDKVRVIPGKMEPDGSRPSYIRGFELTSERRKIPFLPEEIVWFRYFNPLDEYAGLSPIAAGRLSLDMGRDALRFNRDFFANSAVSQDMLYVVNGPIDDDQVKDFYERLDKRFKGPGKGHRPMIWDLSTGPKPEKLGLSQRDMEFLGSLNFTIQDAARIWGVPPPILMSEAQSTYNNVKEGRIQFYVETVSEEWDFIESEINEMLMPRFGEGLRVTFDRSRIFALQEARAELDENDRKSVAQGTMTINEYREARNLQPVEWGDSWWAPMAVMPVTDANTMPTVEEGMRVLSKKSLDEIHKAFINRLTVGERRYRAEMRDLFEKQRRDVLRRAKDIGFKKLGDVQTKQAVGDLFDPAEWQDAFEKVGSKLTRSLLIASANAHASAFGLGAFDAADLAIQDWINERVRFLSTVINDETSRLLTGEIQDAVAEAIAAGEPIPEIQSRIEKVFRFCDKVRSARIARTETLSAQSRGHLAVYDQSGVVEEKKWLTRLDGRERPEHNAANGQIVPIGAKFLVGGESLEAPGIGGTAGNVVNCRCQVIPIVKSQVKRFIANNGNIPQLQGATIDTTGRSV